MIFHIKRSTINCFLILLCGVFMYYCKRDNSSSRSNNFPRANILSNLSNNYIVPALKQLEKDVNTLNDAALSFATNTDVEHLKTLRAAWSKGYMSWHGIAFLDIGKAEELHFRDYMNTYPTSKKRIDKIIASKRYDLKYSYAYDRQGFPALDYLLNGVASTDESTVSYYLTTANALDLLKELTARMKSLCDRVLSEWEDTLSSAFAVDNGNTSASYFNRLINDLIKYYEMYMRTGQVGIPVGVLSIEKVLPKPLPEKVEGFYDKTISKKLFLANLNAMEKVYKGIYYLSDGKGISIYDYVKATGAKKEGKLLSDLIADQFKAVRKSVDPIDNSFYRQIKTDYDSMKLLYEVLQKNVVYMKVDMMTALGVRIDYIDSDGD